MKNQTPMVLLSKALRENYIVLSVSLLSCFSGPAAASRSVCLFWLSSSLSYKQLINANNSIFCTDLQKDRSQLAATGFLGKKSARQVALFLPETCFWLIVDC